MASMKSRLVRWVNRQPGWRIEKGRTHAKVVRPDGRKMPIANRMGDGRTGGGRMQAVYRSRLRQFGIDPDEI